MKKKLTLSIEDKIIDLAKLENINISDITEKYLQQYLGANGIEEIDKKILEKEQELNALNERKKDLLKTGIAMTRNEDMAKTIIKELREAYILRRKQGLDSSDLDFEWLNSPKNIARCSCLNKEPIVLVTELREWYDSTNQSGSI